MRIQKTSYINTYPNWDGSHNVIGYYGSDIGWIPMGRLQPEVTNHVPEQPKSRWVKYLESRS